MKTPPWWLDRPGLAGGIDKTGERAAELLSLGFGCVEFGSVTVQPLAGSNPGLAGLLRQLATVDREKSPKTAIGIGLGLPPDLPPAGLAAEWLAGLRLLAEMPPLADYLSLNLSAAANRRFVGPDLRPDLLAGLAAVARFRAARAALKHPHLAVKLALEAAEVLWPALLAAGVDQLTVVLPEGGESTAGLARVCRLGVGQGPVVVAVGGIRHAADRLAALAAGACEVQVHRLFASHGAATPGLLLALT